MNVVPAPGAPGRLPFWRGDSLGRPAELGQAIGEFTRTLSERGSVAATQHLQDLGLDAWAGANLLAYVAEQAAASHVPTDRTIVVERTRDELGDWRLTVLSPFGAQVHAPWALLARERLSQRFGIHAARMHGDDGIVARLPDLPDDDWLSEATDCLFPDPEEVEAAVTRLVGGSALFASRFRECASRALLLPRPRPGRRAPLWQQRQRSAQLLQIAAEHPTFPIVLEAVRECLQDVYDLPALVALMTSVAQRRIQVVQVSPHAASPFARSLLFGYVSEFLYEGDSPLAERRAAALTLDPALLGELLGQTDLRDLLDPAAIAQVVEQVQHLTAERRARGPEDAADLLRILGPLSAEQATARGVDPAWLEALEAQRRVLRTRVGGYPVWAVVEDAARLRDGLGAPIPPGVAGAHLLPVADPVADLISRFTRTHGPFTVSDLVDSLGLPPAVVTQHLLLARADGRVLEGWFVADAPGPQWCHPDVLRLIKRRSVALLRREIEPVSPPALASFLPRWQNLTGTGGARLRGVDGVLQAVRSMAGVALPVSALEESILPARVPDYSPAMLDELTAAGEVLWTGSAALPGGDGWICLTTDDLGFLLPRSLEAPGNLARDVLDLLGSGGGWFLADLRSRLGAEASDPADVSQALLDLVWAGLVSNDTIEPLRSLLERSPGGRRRARASTGRRGQRPPRGRYADLWRRPDQAAASMSVGDVSAGRPGRQAEPAHTARPRAPRDLPGRFFALSSEPPPPEVMAVARAEAHLDRLGIVTRGAVLASGDPGGFASAYRTLSMMEERGRVQRIYAVEGLGASQFALPGVVDQIRGIERDLAVGPPQVLVMAAADPANAFGAALEWPASDWSGESGSPHRPSRGAGCHVVLVGGWPAIYVERGGRTLLTFPDASPEQESPSSTLAVAARALHDAVRAGTVGPLTITRINGSPAMESGTSDGVTAALQDAGFTLTPKGYRVPR